MTRRMSATFTPLPGARWQSLDDGDDVIEKQPPIRYLPAHWLPTIKLIDGVKTWTRPAFGFIRNITSADHWDTLTRLKPKLIGEGKKANKSDETSATNDSLLGTQIFVVN